MSSGDGTTIPIERFTTDGMPEDQRFDRWHHRVMPSVGRVFETTMLEPFALSSASMMLGDVSTLYTRVTANDWDRSAALRRADNIDALVVSIRFAGLADGDADGRSFQAPGGSILLLDLARPQVHRSAASHSASVMIPRAVAERTFGPMAALHGLVLPPAASMLLRSHMREVEKAVDTLPAAQAPLLGQTVFDLLTIAVSQATATPEPAARAVAIAARRRAEAAIEGKLGSATLTVANLCRWTGTSRSTLYRLFEADGGVQAFIRTRRLSRVAEDLRRDERGRIGDIAERWGFCDPAYLARLFRAEHGLPPGEYRAMHATGRDEHAPLDQFAS